MLSLRVLFRVLFRIPFKVSVRVSFKVSLRVPCRIPFRVPSFKVLDFVLGLGKKIIDFICFLMFWDSLGGWVYFHVPKSKLD